MCTIPQPTLPCPLCCQPNFSSVDSLRTSLVSVTKRPLMCPICNDILLGLDKLTIHLFGHSIATVDLLLQSPPSTSSLPSSSSPAPIYMKIENETLNVMPTAADDAPAPQSQSTVGVATADVRAIDSMKMVRRRRMKSINRSEQSTSAPSPTRSELNVNEQAQCYICGYTFRSKELQRMHLRLVHEITTNETGAAPATTRGDDAPPTLISRFHCEYCAKYFKMKGSLRLHLRMVHGVFGVAAKAATNQKGGDGDVTQIATSMTEECERLAPPPQRLTTSASNESIAVTAGAADAIDHNSATDTKSWKCETCGKSFTTKYFLKKHKRLHTGEMPYTCELCSKTFTFQQSYHKHLLYHTDEKKHTCTICGRAFKELSTLHNHERIHSGEKPYKCETCDKCFRQRVSYLVHRRIHTGVMPYKCTACDTSFRYKVSQRTHKCAAQPPGMVIRQAGDLVQKLIKQNGLMVTLPDVGSTDLSIASHGYTVTPHHHIDPIEGGQFINSTQTLDAFVAESYARLGIDDDAKTTTTQMPDSPSITALMDALDNIQIPSPSERLQNVCLYSSSSPPAVAAAAAAAVTPSADASSTGNDLFAQTLDTINEDSFKQLLYGNIDDLNHMI